MTRKKIDLFKLFRSQNTRFTPEKVRGSRQEEKPTPKGILTFKSLPLERPLTGYLSKTSQTFWVSLIEYYCQNFSNIAHIIGPLRPPIMILGLRILLTLFLRNGRREKHFRKGSTIG